MSSSQEIRLQFPFFQKIIAGLGVIEMLRATGETFFVGEKPL